jgi:hypothetical protein
MDARLFRELLLELSYDEAVDGVKLRDLVEVFLTARLEAVDC